MTKYVVDIEWLQELWGWTAQGKGLPETGNPAAREPMSPYESAHWTEFALGQLGASAALAGLVFVSLSINVRDVMQSRLLVNRAAEAVILLGTLLATSTAVLIPGQARGALAAELIVLGAGTLLFVWQLQRGAATGAASRSAVVIRRVSGLSGPVLVAIAGLSLVLGEGGGLYWWPAAVLLAYTGALAGAWVLLVEILR